MPTSTKLLCLEGPPEAPRRALSCAGSSVSCARPQPLRQALGATRTSSGGPRLMTSWDADTRAAAFEYT